MESALLIALGLGAVAQAGPPYPDQSDLFRAADGKPNVELVLDTSCSMGSGPQAGVCIAFPTIGSAHTNSTPPTLVKTDQLKATLTGCESSTDGILDKWADRVNFAIREFGGSRTGLLAEFGSAKGDLENAVANLLASGGTPMTSAMRNAAFHIQTYFDNNPLETTVCRENFMVVMTDGEGNNAVGANWDFACDVPHNNPKPGDVIACDSGTCNPEDVTPANPSNGAAYVNDARTGSDVDMQCNVDGVQNINTYTIGFNTNAVTETILKDTASLGGGLFYEATSYADLDNAFTEIITDIVSRSAVSFTGGSIQNDGLFQGNYIYRSAFKPAEEGAWFGTVRKYCVLPLDLNGDLDPSGTDCLFRFKNTTDLNSELQTNPKAKDLWTSVTTQDASVGGAGGAILSTNFGGKSVGDLPPASPLTKRKILTWKPDQDFTSFLDLNLTSLNMNDTLSPNFCEHAKLINYLHGYTYDVADCDTCTNAADAGCAPAFVGWPLGASIDSPLVLLKYTEECESASARCYVVSADDRGMIHFFDARGDENGAPGHGEEVSAIVPGDLFAGGDPNNITRTVNNQLLRDVMDQPVLDSPHRHYVDGGIRLVHVDDGGVCAPGCTNLVANGTIDPGESAHLVITLGRGGQQMLMIPVQTGSGLATTGVPDLNNAPRRMSPKDEPDTEPFYQIRDMWAAPWVGQARLASGAGDAIHNVIAFASGHQNYLDDPTAPFALQPQGLGPAYTVEEEGCETFLITAGVDPADATLACGGAFPDPCTACTVVPPDSTCGTTPCYDWVGYPSSANPGLVGPLRWTSGTKKALAYQLEFSKFDLGAGDCLRILDGRQNLVQELCGNHAGPSAWVLDEKFFLELVTDGDNSTMETGFTVSKIRYLEEDGDPSKAGVSKPTVYVMDIDEWAAEADLETGYRQALKLRFTSDCGVTLPGETCVDKSTTDSGDLEHMNCPISAEVMGYTEGDLLRALYVGDECGQLWKFYSDLQTGAWAAKRLLRLNRADGTGAVVSGLQSKDYRKIFSKVDLVVSQCNGNRAVGVYFGTGNVQRAGSKSNLEDDNVTREPSVVFENVEEVNVIGVVWDSADLPADASLAELKNVTDVAKIDEGELRTNGNQAHNGFFIELDPDEKMLRAPLVFKGAAFFKTFLPIKEPTECLSAEGKDKAYVFDNCNAEPLVDVNGDGYEIDAPNERLAWEGETDVGSGFQLFTPKGKAPFVSLANLGVQTKAKLVEQASSQVINLLMWRFL